MKLTDYFSTGGIGGKYQKVTDLGIFSDISPDPSIGETFYSSGTWTAPDDGHVFIYAIGGGAGWTSGGDTLVDIDGKVITVGGGYSPPNDILSGALSGVVSSSHYDLSSAAMISGLSPFEKPPLPRGAASTYRSLQHPFSLSFPLLTEKTGPSSERLNVEDGNHIYSSVSSSISSRRNGILGGGGVHPDSSGHYAGILGGYGCDRNGFRGGAGGGVLFGFPVFVKNGSIVSVSIGAGGGSATLRLRGGDGVCTLIFNPRS